ncbi:MAG: hypothetical protein NC401_18960 [Ruminococcus sp.]|nr:hypothetical protein [Ruminococcus sp.]
MDENEIVTNEEKGIQLEQLDIGRTNIEKILSENFAYAEAMVNEAAYLANTANGLV